MVENVIHQCSASTLPNVQYCTYAAEFNFRYHFNVMFGVAFASFKSVCAFASLFVVSLEKFLELQTVIIAMYKTSKYSFVNGVNGSRVLTTY